MAACVLFAYITHSHLANVELLVTLATPPLPGCRRFIPMWPWCRFEAFHSLQNALELLSAAFSSRRTSATRREINLQWAREGAFTPPDSSPFKRTPVPFPAPPGVVRFNRCEGIHHTWVHTKTLGPEKVGQKHLVPSPPSEQQMPRNASFFRPKYKNGIARKTCSFMS